LKKKKHTKENIEINNNIEINDNVEINDNIELNNDIKKGRSEKRKKRNKIKWILMLILIIFIIWGSFFTTKVYVNGGKQFNLKGVLATIVGHDEKTLQKLPKVYCLVTGQSQNLTDTIMICAYDPKTQEASILSIPRDTFVGNNKKKANSYDKINATYQISPEKTLEAVNDLTGMNIKYYLNIDTEALRDIVDSIGGVYFDVPIDMDYDDGAQNLHIHMKKGYQLLDGDKAEQVVRFRHNNNGTSYPTEYGDNDLGRMKTQRNFVEAVIKKLATPATLTKVPELIKIAEKNITTNLDISKAKDYAPYAVEFKTENLKTAVLPGTPECINNIWFYSQDKKETKNVIAELFTEEDDEVQTKSQNNNVDVNSNPIIDNNKVSNNNSTSANNTAGDSNVSLKNNNTSVNNTISKKSTTSVNNVITSNNNSNTIIASKEDKKKNSEVKIEILNGTSNSSVLNEMKTKLKENGYNVVKTGITSNTSKTMIINRSSKSNDIVSSIKENLNNVGIISTSTSNSNADVTIIIGKDYN